MADAAAGWGLRMMVKNSPIAMLVQLLASRPEYRDLPWWKRAWHRWMHWNDWHPREASSRGPRCSICGQFDE